MNFPFRSNTRVNAKLCFESIEKRTYYQKRIWLNRVTGVAQFLIADTPFLTNSDKRSPSLWTNFQTNRQSFFVHASSVSVVQHIKQCTQCVYREGCTYREGLQGGLVTRRHENVPLNLRWSSIKVLRGVFQRTGGSLFIPGDSESG